MAALRFPLVPFLGYSPSAGKERLLLHACKGSGVVGRVAAMLYEKATQHGMSMTYAWDDGSGRCLEPLGTLFAKSREVHVVSDISPYGVVSLQRIASLLDRLKVSWKYVGITDGWLGVVAPSRREAWIKAMAIRAPREMKHVSIDRVTRLGVVRLLGSRCRSILESGFVLELEAFLRPGYRSTLRRILRTETP